MTCIAGLVHDGRVYIGADSAGVEGFSLATRKDRKVFRNGDFLFGFTSSFRMGQLLAYSFDPPRRHPDQGVYAYMVTDFVNAVRECLRQGGFATRNNEAEEGGTFLVGYEGRLFQIQDDYQVGERLDGFDACGCGDQIALGVLAVTEGQEPEDRITSALVTAERFSAGVRGPFYVEVIGDAVQGAGVLGEETGPRPLKKGDR